jgi:FkbM family methyltransferase
MKIVTTTVRNALCALGLLGLVKRHYYVWCDQFGAEKAKNLLQGIICPRDLVFDIGAFIGSRTFLFASMGAQVVAVEPQPVCLDILRKRFEKNPRISIVAGLVSRSPGEADLWVDDQVPEIASIRKEWVCDGPTRVKGARVYPLRVESHTLDALISEYGKPKYIKIDAEGHEREILQGLSCSCEFISFEIHRGDRQKLIECIQEVKRLGVYDANLSLGDSDVFVFSEWQTIEAFLAWSWPEEAPEFGDLFLHLGLGPKVRPIH